ncbi:SAG family member [Eimeria brunetti]|uniref:SAG family member n=1 Tax=Eimeria brunetti TaxID=51314 RepID=U6L694_9EIME|nr:SAG family member [Eimeria brunetti]
MAPLKFLSLAGASALLVAQANNPGAKAQSPVGGGGDGAVTYTVSLEGPAVCLADINEAREAAGLPKFSAATDDESKTLPQANNEQKIWDPVCKALIAKEGANPDVKSESAGNAFKSGTYAFMALSSDQADCTAAVDHWKAAFSNFTSIPPAKTEDEPLYQKQQNISFVAMYNPSNDAAADCRVVTCTQAASDSGGGNNLRSVAEQKTGHALLCMTTPEAFKDKETPPFTEDQWSKIKTSLTGSASAVGPSLLAIAAVALGLAAL